MTPIAERRIDPSTLILAALLLLAIILLYYAISPSGGNTPTPPRVKVLEEYAYPKNAPPSPPSQPGNCTPAYTEVVPPPPAGKPALLYCRGKTVETLLVNLTRSNIIGLRVGIIEYIIPSSNGGN